LNGATTFNFNAPFCPSTHNPFDFPSDLTPIVAVKN